MDGQPLDLLARMMDRFARENWDDRYGPERGALAIEGDRLVCTVQGESIEGHPTAPLTFVSGAWGLIYAHEHDGRFRHRVDGRVNRVWPNGVKRSTAEHGLDDEVRAWAAAWPGLLFSSSLYRKVGTPGLPAFPRRRQQAPSKTSLTGILKRIVPGAGDSDPLERLKTAEFIEAALRQEWSYTAEDPMMAIVGAPLMSLLDDPEPAIRELAMLALDTCAEACWHNRAYGLYEPICRKLIEAGLNAHDQFVRLAESAYAAGDVAEGDRLWAVGTAGQDPSRTVKIGSAFDALGNLNDLHTRILRQAGGANVAWSRGLDPNPPRQKKLEKKGIVPPPPEVARRHRELARVLLARAAEGADARLAIDLPAAQEGREVPLGRNMIDPRGRRLFLDEIFELQSRIAEDDGEEDLRLRLLFKAQDIRWRLHGERSDHWRWGNEDELVLLARGRDDAALVELGMPAYLRPLVARARQAAELAGSPDGVEQLFWRRFLLSVRDSFLRKKDDDHKPLPGEELAAGFHVTREGAEMRIAHTVLGEPVRGSLSSPVLNCLRAWHAALRAAHGFGAEIRAADWQSILLGADDRSMFATIADEALASGASREAVALYRVAAGMDPLVRLSRDGSQGVPPALDALAPELRTAVMHRSPLEEEGGRDKLKPRGKRIEQLALDYETADPVTRRYVGDCLRRACHAGGSEIARVIKSGEPLLTRMWRDGDPQVQETAVLALFALLEARRTYLPRAEVEDLMALAAEAEIADVASLQPPTSQASQDD